MALAPRAVEVLARIMDDPEAGAPSQVRAAIDLLDRTVGKAVDVSLDITPAEDRNGALDAAIANALRARGVIVGGQVEHPVIEAEIVEDDPSDQGEQHPEA